MSQPVSRRTALKTMALTGLAALPPAAEAGLPAHAPPGHVSGRMTGAQPRCRASGPKDNWTSVLGRAGMVRQRPLPAKLVDAANHAVARLSGPDAPVPRLRRRIESPQAFRDLARRLVA